MMFSLCSWAAPSDQHGTPPMSANVKGWGDTLQPRFASCWFCCAVLISEAGRCVLAWAPRSVSGFCGSPLHTALLARHGPPSEDINQMAGSALVPADPPGGRASAQPLTPGPAGHSTVQPAPQPCLQGDPIDVWSYACPNIFLLQ